MKEVFLSRSPFTKQQTRLTTSFIFPEGIRHLLAVPATLNDIISFLQKKGLLVAGPMLSAQRHDLPPLIHYMCTWNHGVRSSGAHTDPHIAKIKALSEGLERIVTYSSELHLNKRYPAKKLPQTHIINPFPKTSYFKEQLANYPNLGIETDRGTYVQFRSLDTNKSYFLPEDCLVWGKSSNPTLVSRTSNGGGARTDKDAALLSALHECIERDAFLYHWLCKLTPDKIDASSIKNQETIHLLTSLHEMDIEATMFVLDNNVGIPTFITTLIDKRQEPAVFVVAGATHAFNYEDAIYKSLEEALSILQESLEDAEVTQPTSAPAFCNSSMGRKERIALWKGSTLQELAWLFSGDTVRLESLSKKYPELTSGKNNSSQVFKRMKKHFAGITVLYTYIQSPVLNQVGLHVAKVVIPEFIQFYLVEHLANLNGNKRLMEKLSTRDLYTHLNPLPHPYP